MRQLWVGSVFVRYVLIGGAAYALEMAVLLGLHNGLGWAPVMSVAVSFWVGFAVAFVLQKIVVFQNRKHTRHIIAWQVMQYSLLVGWNYLFTLLLAGLVASHVGIFAARTIAIVIITSWNFLFYKIIFKDKDTREYE